MGMKLKYITPLLAAGAAAVAIAAAPAAFAANQQSCSGTVCQSPATALNSLRAAENRLNIHQYPRELESPFTCQHPEALPGT